MPKKKKHAPARGHKGHAHAGAVRRVLKARIRHVLRQARSRKTSSKDFDAHMSEVSALERRLASLSK